MRILVTGCAGFLGYYTCERFLTLGHKVYGLDNLNSDYSVSIKNSRIEKLQKHQNFYFEQFDITSSDTPKILENQKIDEVIHLAGKDIYYKDEDLFYSDYLDINVIGVARVFELAKKLGARRFIFSSTHSVYGRTKKKVLSERKIVPKPISPHGSSKLAAERVLEFMSGYYKLPTIVLRIFTVYGPDMRPYTVIPYFIKRIASNEPLKTYLGIDQTRDFVYINDVVDSFVSAIKSRLKYQIINIASGKSHSLRELAELIAKKLGKSSEDLGFDIAKSNVKELIVTDVTADITKANRILNYIPKVSFEEGLDATVEWYKKHPKELLESAMEVS